MSKKKYTYLHLVESVRTENGPRQRLVLNLGSLDIDRSQYHTLARRIEDILTGNRSLFEIDEQLERHAGKAADKIFSKRAEQLSGESEQEFELISAKSLEVSTSRSVGCEYVCHAMWRELDLDGALKREGVSARVLPILEALVVGRLIDPGSERWTKRWAEELSSIYEFSGTPMRNSLQSYYRGSDHLYEAKDALEKHLSGREKELFDVQESIVLYDLTNTYFEGQYRGNPEMAYGKSKERRSDCKLMTMGLVVDAEGFAKYSKIYPGNQYEADTLEEMVAEMEGHMSGQEKPTVVMDAGIATEQNIGRLAEHGYPYIVVNRGKAPFEIEFEGMRVIKEDEKSGTKIEVKRNEHGEEVYLLVRSERRRLKEEAMSGRVEQLLVDRLKHLKAGLGKKHRVRRYSKVVEAIGRLKQKYGKVAQLYEITVIACEEADPNADAIDIRWTKKTGRYDEARNAEGTYVLRSNRGDLSDEQIWRTYIMLGRIERSFKDMKSHLGLRP
ncbi:MAG: IS1634 family transposase, partial [Spirochaetia bacterium]